MSSVTHLFTHTKFLDWNQDLFLAEHVQQVTIGEVTGSDQSHVEFVSPHIVQLCIYIYQLNHESAIQEMQEEENVLAAHHWQLPSMELNGLWENLIYDDDIQSKLLNYVNTTMLFSGIQGFGLLDNYYLSVDPHVISWNRVLLLHGPPGTGKTSLCKALAQKLSIRLYPRYRSGRLIEINAHSLFSKWFSESGKLVMKCFEGISELVADGKEFVCVLIDEVESLTAARKAATSGMEPSDAIRVVNALLTQIDQLKQHRNVLIMTTSNISEAIDLAFIDRADIKQYIPYPSRIAIYAILRSCLMELSRIGLIQHMDLGSTLLEWRGIDLFFKAKSQDPSSRLFSLAGNCIGFSGRCLRKLPFLAHSMYIKSSTTTLPLFLDALEKAADHENKSRHRLSHSPVCLTSSPTSSITSTIPSLPALESSSVPFSSQMESMGIGKKE